MRIINQTPFPFAFVPGRVLFPKHTATLVVKSSFSIGHEKALTPLDPQLPFSGDAFPDDDGKRRSRSQKAGK